MVRLAHLDAQAKPVQSNPRQTPIPSSSPRQTPIPSSSPRRSIVSPLPGVVLASPTARGTRPPHRAPYSNSKRPILAAPLPGVVLASPSRPYVPNLPGVVVASRGNVIPQTSLDRRAMQVSPRSSVSAPRGLSPRRRMSAREEIENLGKTLNRNLNNNNSNIKHSPTGDRRAFRDTNPQASQQDY